MPFPDDICVYTGAIGSILLSPEIDGPEGGGGGIEGNEFIQVGRAAGITVKVSSPNRAVEEHARRRASDPEPGSVCVRGHIDRAYMNGAHVSLLLGSAARCPSQSRRRPAFNITLSSENAANPGVRTTLTLHGVTLEQWSRDMPDDDVVMEAASFQALSVTVADDPE